MKSLVVIGFLLGLLTAQPADAFCVPWAMGDCETTGGGIPPWLMFTFAALGLGMFVFGAGLKGAIYVIVNVVVFYATMMFLLDRIGGFAFILAGCAVFISNGILKRLVPFRDGE